MQFNILYNKLNKYIIHTISEYNTLLLKFLNKQHYSISVFPKFKCVKKYEHIFVFTVAHDNVCFSVKIVPNLISVCFFLLSSNTIHVLFMETTSS